MVLLDIIFIICIANFRFVLLVEIGILINIKNSITLKISGIKESTYEKNFKKFNFFDPHNDLICTNCSR